MCGIAGCITSEELSENKIHKCLNSLMHRGPDANNFVKFKLTNNKYIYLFHTRLAILDLDNRSIQPFSLFENKLVFNGEIYNYLEIKNNLEKKYNYKFKTKSDTEVLAALLNFKGIESLNICEGMWSFALFNSKDEKLILSRDRFGEKPLYIHHDRDNIFFGSEPSAIFSLLGYQLPINYNHVKRFFVNGYKSTYKVRETFFQNLFEIESGGVATWDINNGYQEHKWWNNFLKQEKEISYVDAVKGAKEKLIKSVELRMRADVPIAFCLSGGIDSNCLVSIAKKVLNKDVHGFSIINKDERYEEEKLIDISVKELSLKHTKLHINKKNFIKNLKGLIKKHCAPICTLNYYAHYLLMQKISGQGYKVSISGTGADELFSGYYDHHLAYLYELNIKKNNNFESSCESWQKHISPIVRNPFLKNKEYFINNPLDRSHIYLDSSEFSKYLFENFEEPFNENLYTVNLLRNRMLNELFHEIVPTILHEDDLNSMHCSVENRSPYLDSNLFEFMQTIPTPYLIKNSLTKKILRESVKDIVPSEIISSRRKVGFNIPIEDYFDINERYNYEWLMSNSELDNIIKKDKIINFAKKEKKTNSESKLLFNYINIKLFMENFN